MRIGRFLDKNKKIRLGTDFSDETAICLSGDLFGELKKTRERVEIQKWLSPVNPPAVFCIGINYAEHATETGMKPPEYPVVFMKNPASVTGHQMPIILPSSCRNPLQVDYEVELAVIIGKTAKNISSTNALDYVLGYTIANDVSARTWQANAGAGQWVRGKSFDTFCPMGPFLVTADEIPDPDALDIHCVVNGRVMQEGNTCDMIFKIPRLIEYLSEDTTLLPGTVILTGTPSGVGFTRNPPVFLGPGDYLEMTIENLGTLENTVR
jgi:2-keto-4-pentenoate hydratase/2-oxohepta-3-ene-1,7-dioic acid hydratase in catechol pathway